MSNIEPRRSTFDPNIIRTISLIRQALSVRPVNSCRTETRSSSVSEGGFLQKNGAPGTAGTAMALISHARARCSQPKGGDRTSLQGRVAHSAATGGAFAVLLPHRR